MKLQQVELTLWRPCPSPPWLMPEAGRSHPSKGKIELWFTEIEYTLEGESYIMTFYIFSVAMSFLPFNWWQVWYVFFFLITLLSFSKCNSDWVVVGGHLKWTPQRPCLGNEIALAMAFCHVAPQCILMISGTWRSTALQDSHSLIRLASHSLSLSVICLLCLFPACFLISLP